MVNGDTQVLQVIDRAYGRASSLNGYEMPFRAMGRVKVQTVDLCSSSRHSTWMISTRMS